VLKGCKHGCRYCYAFQMARRFGRVFDRDEWTRPEVRWTAVDKGYGKRKGRVMFPTSHDLFLPREFLEPCMVVLRKLLAAGNSVLVTTKPDPAVIREICGDPVVKNWKENVQFRFTITSLNERTAGIWEPGAPPPAARINALRHAFNEGFKTSVSIEPLLDHDPLGVVRAVEPWITESIWLGKMNHLQRSYPGVPPEELERVRELCSREFWTGPLGAVNALDGHPLVRWKDSVRKWLEK